MIKDEELARIQESKRRVDALRERTEAVFAELERRATRYLDRGKNAVERARDIVDVPMRVRAHPGIVVVAAGSALASLVYALVSRQRARHRIAEAPRRPDVFVRQMERAGRSIPGSIGRALLVGAAILLGGIVVTTPRRRALPAHS